MDEIKKSYYAIIPASVRYDERLKPNAKLLYGEITALCNEKGYCWAGNDYFSQLYQVKKETVSRWINQLVSYGYLRSEIIYAEGTRQIINRYLFLSQEGHDKKINTPIDKKVKDNNTSFNNTFNNTLDIKDKSSKQASTAPLFEAVWKIYPKKTMKKEALAAYKRALKKGTTPEDIEAGVKKYLAYLEANKTWLKPMDGGRWFQKERWGDEYEVKKDDRKRYAGEYEDFF